MNTLVACAYFSFTSDMYRCCAAAALSGHDWTGCQVLCVAHRSCPVLRSVAQGLQAAMLSCAMLLGLQLNLQGHHSANKVHPWLYLRMRRSCNTPAAPSGRSVG